MRAIFFVFAICFGLHVFAADQPTLFRDEDSGLTMQIPPGLKRTWNISNCDNGLEITVFNSDEDQDNCFLIVIGKFPIERICELEQCEFYPTLFQQVGVNFSFEKIYIQKEGVIIQAETLPSLASENYLGKRIRINLSTEESEDSIFADVHFFFQNNLASAVITGICPEVNEEDLNEFSEAVVGSLQFIRCNN